MNKKTIWITGGSTGIGKALAIKFASKGWNVAISARRAELLNELSAKPTPREMDMLLSAGERITMSLLSMHLNSLGHSSFSLTGSQAGIITTSRHGKAEIEEISGERVREGIERGDIVIVAGFQGFNRDTREITTLGRGGDRKSVV